MRDGVFSQGRETSRKARVPPSLRLDMTCRVEVALYLHQAESSEARAHARGCAAQGARTEPGSFKRGSNREGGGLKKGNRARSRARISTDQRSCLLPPLQVGESGAAPCAAHSSGV
ncbi:hypothetical protein thsps21_16380 [Pseudomonas sp. No.21]|nr:hypothetical protein TUM20249_50740 [Pseudomonas tohonis]